MNYLDAQRLFAPTLPHPIVNVGCKEDPAGLADFGAINLDILPYDHDTHATLHPPRFVQASALEMPFADNSIGSIVLADVLEHFSIPAANSLMSELSRCLRPNGILLITFPLDSRPPHEQGKPPSNITKGITVHHQTLWNDQIFMSLLNAFYMVIDSRMPLSYPACGCDGWVVVARKENR